MAPKLRFSRGLKAKAPGAVTACVPGPLRRRSSKFLQARRPRLAQELEEATMGKVTIFFLPSRVFQVYDCYFTNVLTQRSCLGFLLTADSQCFTRNDARTFVPTIPRRRLWPGERSLWVETSRYSFTAEVWSFSPKAPPSLVSSPSKYPPSFVALAFNKTKQAELSPRSPSNVQLVPACRIWEQPQRCFPPFEQKTARSIEELFSQWKRPRRASSDQRTDEEDTSETCNNNHAGGRALTNAQKRNWGGTYIYVLGHRDGRFGDVYIRPVAVNGLTKFRCVKIW